MARADGGEGPSEHPQATNRFPEASGTEHNFNHILPSVGWGSSVAQSVSLVGTTFQLEVNDSNDSNCC